MINAIGFIELNSIAKGIEVADHMLKVANVQLMFSTATCPGKYITLIYGDVGSVENSIKAAKLLGGEFIIDDLMIPNVDEQIFPAITGSSNVEKIGAIGVIESLAMASLIVAADTCVKASGVQLVELRLGSGIGGKSYLVMTGDVSEVDASMEAGVAVIKESGNIVYYTVIPSPHKDFKSTLL
ncbi:BMC domain-containing protein [Acetobacterium bakii]|uniref:Propanediol utilization protein n=1 Tax=Acetobacterium bakii TaxID=52689 RepID=A0A0L6U1U5_9FIRM|nr:BMC domain-containing protein [Acetobacterium bakii]KNZ42481.1 propanediol utilization protein [Acetobacterium bakii]